MGSTRDRQHVPLGGGLCPSTVVIAPAGCLLHDWSACRCRLVRGAIDSTRAVAANVFLLGSCMVLQYYGGDSRISRRLPMASTRLVQFATRPQRPCTRGELFWRA